MADDPIIYDSTNDPFLFGTNKLPLGENSGYKMQVRNKLGFPGHTYVEITDPQGHKTDFGLYPDTGDGSYLSRALRVAGHTGIVQGYETSPPPSVGDSTVISLTPEQYDRLSNFINQSILHPPAYNILTGDDCAGWVWDVIDETFGLNLGHGMGYIDVPIIDTLINAPNLSWLADAVTNSAKAAWHKYVSPHYEPLVLDLGSGIQTTTLQGGVFFDNQNNGFAENTAWVGESTGILVNDPTDAPVTNGSQMFGTSTSLSGGGYAVDGFAALADLDSNSDGVIDSSDTAWSGLRVWVDANGNGITDSGELKTMATAGVASIDTARDFFRFSYGGVC